MSKTITYPLLFVAGILFTFAFPEPSMAVNEAVKPFVMSAFTYVGEFIGDALSDFIQGYVS